MMELHIVILDIEGIEINRFINLGEAALDFGFFIEELDAKYYFENEYDVLKDGAI